MSQSNALAARRRGPWRSAVIAGVTVVLGLAVIEGLCSFGLFTWDIATRSDRPLAERLHTQHDAELGWSNIPDLVVTDVYGPGRHVSINSLGFRSRSEYPVDVPEGRQRILVSGDSFAFGYGVSDDETWCSLLEQSNANLQVVNMGLGGYGFDQVFLWYKRDGNRLRHTLHLCCLGSPQFPRMMRTELLGYAKPMLRMQGDRLNVLGTPVPAASLRFPWVTQNEHLLRQCRVFELGRRILAGTGPGSGDETLASEDVLPIVVSCLREMHHEDAQNGSRLVVAWLPMQEEIDSREGDLQRDQLFAILAPLEIPTIDLTDDFRKLPPGETGRHFIAEGEVDFPGAAGHYSVDGNRFVAERILRHLEPLFVKADEESEPRRNDSTDVRP